MWTDDPVADAWRRDLEFERWLARRPMCECCKNHIQDEDAYYINGNFYCEDCLETYFKLTIEDDY